MFATLLIVYTNTTRPLEDRVLDRLCPEPTSPDAERAAFYRAWVLRVARRSPADALVLHQYLSLLSRCDMIEATRLIAELHGKPRSHFYRILRRLRNDARAVLPEGRNHAQEED